MQYSHQQLNERYLNALLRGDRHAATAVVDQAIASGAGLMSVYLNVLTRAQERIGQMWMDGTISVADEHRATLITLGDMERLRRSSPPPRPLGLRAVVACVEGELHMVGAQVVSDFLAMDGWETDFLGADIPTPDLVGFVAQRLSHMVALSVTMDEHLNNAGVAIAALRELPQPPLVMAGGIAFERNAHLAGEYGADAVAIGALDSLRVARKLAGIEESGHSLTDLLASVGARIHAERQRAGWSQQQLAEASGLDRAYISSVERGKQNVTLGAVMRLASALEIPVERILVGEGWPPRAFS